jgi:hypothetical protein
MRTNWDVLSARTLGALALPDACERCFWLHQRIGAPDSPFPGIFSSIDSYSKKVLQAALQHAQRLPHWFERFGLHGEPLPSPHHSWFKIATGHGSLQLRGTPDEILRAPDGGLIIIDYKTARFKPEDSLRPLYEVQLNVYARIAENLTPPRNGYPFPCRVQTLGLMYYDPLTEVDHPDKITPAGSSWSSMRTGFPSSGATSGLTSCWHARGQSCLSLTRLLAIKTAKPAKPIKPSPTRCHRAG